MLIDPKKQTFKENYKLMIGSILPRPIAFVSTVSHDGIHNLAPFSFFTGITSEPPTVCFSPTRRGTDGEAKDTLKNIESTGEFVINIVNESIVEQMNETATEFPPDVDEFQKSGLTAIGAKIVKAPLVNESPISFECKKLQVIEIGEAKAGGGFLVIGEIVMFHIKDALLENGRIKTDLLNPIGRLAGAEYTKLGERFTLQRKSLKK
ncbi:MAG: flavin reductase family protein [Calditrichaeota bacterium]|nr:MAG: flavin reductase family protein [Calditrichota bacterium]MBL1205070.1 flavin reductase family protein [Calditrichota bacterium]NOG44900.1 flavin reductase family protein [Calditrichota bacterium]